MHSRDGAGILTNGENKCVYLPCVLLNNIKSIASILHGLINLNSKTHIRKLTCLSTVLGRAHTENCTSVNHKSLFLFFVLSQNLFTHGMFFDQNEH